jgi:serine/threonine-protein kinase RsbW
VSHQKLVIRVIPRTDSISGLLDRLEAYAETTALPSRAAHRLAMVCEELATNVAMHGGSGVTYVEIAVGCDGEQLHVSIEDDGQPFDPLAMPAPDITARLEDRKIGGLGIHFVRNMVKDLTYERAGAVNRLTAVLDTTE